MSNMPSVLVCVTGQKTCDRLIDNGLTIAKKKEAPLYVLHVAKKDASLLGAGNDSEALNYLYALASNAGAEMTVQRAQDIQSAIDNYAKKINAKDLVLGAGPNNENNFSLAQHLKAVLPDVTFHII